MLPHRGTFVLTEVHLIPIREAVQLVRKRGREVKQMRLFRCMVMALAMASVMALPGEAPAEAKSRQNNKVGQPCKHGQKRVGSACAGKEAQRWLAFAPDTLTHWPATMCRELDPTWGSPNIQNPYDFMGPRWSKNRCHPTRVPAGRAIVMPTGEWPTSLPFPTLRAVPVPVTPAPPPPDPQ